MKLNASCQHLNTLGLPLASLPLLVIRGFKMIAYIFISYVFMFVVCFYCVVIGGEDFKPNFKWWVFSPISLPLFVVCSFINW